MLPAARVAVGWAVAAALAVAACAARSGPYEYEESLALTLDGSAAVELHASVAALNALRGAGIDADPRVPVDLERMRALLAGEGARIAALDALLEDGRPFVRARVEVDDLTQLSRIPAFAWSLYRLRREGDVWTYRQIVGPPNRRALESTGWTGEERVVFRVRVPGEITGHTAPSGRTRGGDTAAWEQPLAVRLRGGAIDLQIEFAPR